MKATSSSLEKILSLLEHKARLQQANFDKQGDLVKELQAELAKGAREAKAHEALLTKKQAEINALEAKVTTAEAQHRVELDGMQA